MVEFSLFNVVYMVELSLFVQNLFTKEYGRKLQKIVGNVKK